jgi:hypothetical protein
MWTALRPLSGPFWLNFFPFYRDGVVVDVVLAPSPLFVVVANPVLTILFAVIEGRNTWILEPCRSLSSSWCEYSGVLTVLASFLRFW